MSDQFPGFILDAPQEAPDFNPPARLEFSSWRSLLQQLHERSQQKDEPAPVLTSRPVDLGMLPGDRMEVPWYRSIFTNIGDVVAPQTQPPLELESQPVDVGELLADQLQHGWWTSLLRSLADKFAPEKLPTLHLTTGPVKLDLLEHDPWAGVGQAFATPLLAPHWSELIPFTAANPSVDARTSGAITDAEGIRSHSWTPPAAPLHIAVAGPLADADASFTPLAGNPEAIHEMTARLRNALRATRLRELLWITAATAEIVVAILWCLGKLR